MQVIFRRIGERRYAVIVAVPGEAWDSTTPEQHLQQIRDVVDTATSRTDSP
jgi:hypothetical protein